LHFIIHTLSIFISLHILASTGFIGGLVFWFEISPRFFNDGCKFRGVDEISCDAILPVGKDRG
jgi:hypothetical protein